MEARDLGTPGCAKVCLCNSADSQQLDPKSYRPCVRGRASTPPEITNRIGSMSTPSAGRQVRPKTVIDHPDAEPFESVSGLSRRHPFSSRLFHAIRTKAGLTQR